MPSSSCAHPNINTPVELNFSEWCTYYIVVTDEVLEGKGGGEASFLGLSIGADEIEENEGVFGLLGFFFERILS